uniref:Melatonin receptor 1B n=1 Tax=Phocoena sinus TaxID=42100 RepID=A0A8C9CP09_PHOSS
MPENASFANCCEAGGRAESRVWTGAGGARPSRTPRPRWVAPALSARLIVTTAVAIVANLLVILSVLGNRKLRNAGNLFLVSLASADLALCPYPLILLAIFHDSWALGEACCKASPFVMGLSVIGSVFDITAIAINCYCYVCHSVTYHLICCHWHTPLYICLVCLLTLLALVPSFFVGFLEYDPRIYSCTFIPTVSARYTVAVVVVKSESNPCLWSSNIRSFLTTFVVFVIFAVCWAPLNCISLAVAIDPEVAPQVPEGLFVTSYLLAYFNSCLNAIVYGILNQNFCREHKKIIVSAFWNPWHYLQDSSKGSQPPVQADALLPDPWPGNKLMK